MNRRIWSNGYWPLQQDIEDFLKERILQAEAVRLGRPVSEEERESMFFYSEEFLVEKRDAIEERRQKAVKALTGGQ